MPLNLPIVITLSRIAATPLIAVLVFSSGWIPRLTAWVLFIAAAVTDYFDGKLARERNLVTQLGKQLDFVSQALLTVQHTKRLSSLRNPRFGPV